MKVVQTCFQQVSPCIRGHANIQLNIITVAATISVCEKGGQWQKSLSLFTTLQVTWAEKNVVVS